MPRDQRITESAGAADAASTAAATDVDIYTPDQIRSIYETLRTKVTPNAQVMLNTLFIINNNLRANASSLANAQSMNDALMHVSTRIKAFEHINKKGVQILWQLQTELQDARQKIAVLENENRELKKEIAALLATEQSWIKEAESACISSDHGSTASAQHDLQTQPTSSSSSSASAPVTNKRAKRF